MNALVTTILCVALFVGVPAFPRGVQLQERPLALLYVPSLGRVAPLTLLAPLDVIASQQTGDEAITEDYIDTLDSLSQQVPLERWMGGQQEEEEKRSDGEGLRSRRSTQPRSEGGQQGGNNSQRGGVEVDVSRGPGGGRRVEARGEGNVWQSRDGRGRVDVHGHYSRDFGGRQGTGRPQYGGGVRYSHRF